MSGEDGDAVIIGNFTLASPLVSGASPGAQAPTISINGYVYNKDGIVDVHRRIDGMVEVMERQMKICAIKAAEGRRLAQMDHLESVRQIYGALVKVVEGGKKLHTAQKQQYDSGQSTIDATVKAIDKLDKEIAAMKEEVKLK